MSTIPKTFSKDKKRFEENPNDFFETPLDFCEAAIFLWADFFTWVYGQPKRILDPGCGTGNWGRAARRRYPDAHVIGVDIEPNVNPGDNPYNEIYQEDYLSLWRDPSAGTPEFDLVIGNPPYSSESNKNLAMDFVMKSRSLLSKTGTICFLLKTEFTGGKKRREELFSIYRPSDIVVVGRVPFYQHTDNTNTIDYSLFFWGPQSAHKTQLHWFDRKLKVLV